MDVLFCNHNSIYKTLNCDCYDLNRNALSVQFPSVAIYHPPCRSWSRLRKFSSFIPGDHWLAVWSVLRCRRFGGIIEHPMGSYLWHYMNLPLPGRGYDSYGGFTFEIDQVEFGHLCRKRTWLYVVGLPAGIPINIPLCGNKPSFTIASSSSSSDLLACPIYYRSYTPILLAKELLRIAGLISGAASRGVLNAPRRTRISQLTLPFL